MIAVSKKNNETTERLISRFKKQVQQARFLNSLKDERYHKRKITKRQIRQRALMREYYRAIKRKNQFT